MVSTYNAHQKGIGNHRLAPSSSTTHVISTTRDRCQPPDSSTPGRGLAAPWSTRHLPCLCHRRFQTGDSQSRPASLYRRRSRTLPSRARGGRGGRTGCRRSGSCSLADERPGGCSGPATRRARRNRGRATAQRTTGRPAATRAAAAARSLHHRTREQPQRTHAARAPALTPHVVARRI